MRQPSEREVAELAEATGISFASGEQEDYAQVVGETLDLLEGIEELPEPQLPPREYEHTSRSPGYEPTDEEDPYNAWITKCTVKGAETGPLSGMTVGLKDNVSLASIELTNGSDVMQGYVPAVDATIVTRLLDAGATISGKTNLWGFSVGDSDYGPVENPNAPEYSIGGSSSGSAAAVAAEEVDIGIGGDQGGSIRMPASFGGIVGLKPTHGLVPYTGIFGADASLDHTGPMTRTVEDAAIATEVLAGRDGLDPRQPHDLEVQDYTDALDEDISDMTIGVLKEGFEHDVSDPEVNEVVRDAIADLEAMGAETKSVSVPRHLKTGAFSLSVAFYGMGQLFRQNGLTPGADGWYDTGAVEYLGRALDAQSSDLPDTAKNAILLSEYLRRNYQGSIYAKAQNLTLEMRESYDEVLTDADAMVMPTVPMKPPAAGTKMNVDALKENGPGFDVAKNTGMFNLTHHPGLSVPCGTVDDAPVGLMFVGERFDEATLFNLGYAYEQAGT
ncbi:amidase [Halobium palmae]|uniref:Amidase n=1 Tax=Halobium palmae TaxID=1776492 RepID=A0ABD5RUQ7_9EURY